MNKQNVIITRDFQNLKRETGNLYKSIVAISERAKHLSNLQKEEINQKLEDFVTSQDDLKEVFENHEQIKISKYYEKLPKPVLIATEELVEGKLITKYRDQETPY